MWEVTICTNFYCSEDRKEVRECIFLRRGDDELLVYFMVIENHYGAVHWFSAMSGFYVITEAHVSVVNSVS